jgi:Protein of unknown function (DUF2490)
LVDHIRQAYFMRSIAVIGFFFFISTALAAQQTNVHVNLFWFNYNNTIKIDKTWTIASDAQVRTRDWISQWSQFAIRSAAVYKLDKRFALSVGFTWFGNVRYFNKDAVVANEWRPWQEIACQLGTDKNIFLQRLRLEQRFLQKIVEGKKINEFEKRQRLRYRFEFGFPLPNKKMEIHFGNEVMVNLNYLSGNRFFDQNRTFIFFNFRLSPSIFLQYQYIKLFQWQGAGKVLENQDVFRFSLHQQIDCSKRNSNN